MLLIIALAVCSYVNAQKGSVLVMGSVTYNSQKDSNSNLEIKQDVFGFQPKVGYQFHENWTAGIEGNFKNVKQKLVDSSQYKDEIYEFGGFLRYSKPLGGVFSAYADLGIGYTTRKETFKNEITQTYNDSDGFYAGITPAIFIDISKGFGLNFNIGGLNYSTLNTDTASGTSYKTKTFGFTFGESFSVGLSKNF